MIKTDLLFRKDISFSSLLGGYDLCRNCKVVDIDNRRSIVGFECPVCKKKSDGGLFYFHLGILSLLDLLQEAYHTDSIINSQLDTTKSTFVTPSHSILIIILFCTLREVLLRNLLDEYAELKNIPLPVYERLLADNRAYTQMQNKLFPSFFKINWNQAIELAHNKNDGYDYRMLDTLLKKAAEARNTFLHEGNQYIIEKDFAKECIVSIEVLVNFYVLIHNELIHPNFL